MAAPSPTPGPSRPSPTPAAPPSRWTARIESSFEAPIVRPGDYPTRHSTTPNVPIASRAKGCLWGLCVCDALGGAVQFDDPRHVPEVTGLRPIAGFHKPAGSYSDDGAMAIALTKSMIEQGGAYSQVEALERYLNWLHRGHYVAPAGHAAWDVGRGTLNSLRFWEQFTKEHERPTIREGVRLAADLFPIWPKSDNGSLMRMAPVGALFYLSLSAARRVAREDSDLTHPSQQCSDICALYVTLVAYCFVPGMTKEIMMMTVATVDIAERELRMLVGPSLSFSSRLPSEAIADHCRCVRFPGRSASGSLWRFRILLPTRMRPADMSSRLSKGRSGRSSSSTTSRPAYCS